MADLESPEAFAERLLRGIGDLDYIDCFEPGRSAQALADAADTIRARDAAVRREALAEQAHCWHCLVCPEPPSRPHCEMCPADGDCDEADCGEPGCEDDLRALADSEEP